MPGFGESRNGYLATVVGPFEISAADTRLSHPLTLTGYGSVTLNLT